MKVRILHTSDIHGRVNVLLAALWDEDYDIWVDTGDFFPDPPDRSKGSAHAALWQGDWFARQGLGNKIYAALGPRPLVQVRGNHDKTKLADYLLPHGVTVARPSHSHLLEVQGVTFAGIRETYMDWQEPEDRERVQRKARLAADLGADILLSHQPPDHLNSTRYKAFAALPQPGTKAWLCGHIHEDSGKALVLGECTIYNNSLTPRAIELEWEDR